MKWEYARAAPGQRKFVVCNADEGEPGTFKDRVLLTEYPDRVFAGMTIAGYAVGAREGLLYLRAEYAYLLPFLEDVLARRRADGLLGHSLPGKHAFDFDIRIQLGAGAYVCGEETALLNSCEGRSGEPRNRPPFPAQHGYLGFPTVVNNVETLACVTRILEAGPATFCEQGTEQSTGTKLLSVSGDCHRPGVFEVPFGVPLREVLEQADARDAAAVQVGGPSGRLVGRAEHDRGIGYEDLATGGALVVFGPDRDLIEIAAIYLEFFEDEGCGTCSSCRVGNTLLREGLERLAAGRCDPADLQRLQQLARTVQATSRCGLGQTSPNPLLSLLEGFHPLVEAHVRLPDPGWRAGFDLDTALQPAAALRTGASHE
jgi:[NiFe] hydrogenase diaphorase moiety large subunit